MTLKILVVLVTAATLIAAGYAEHPQAEILHSFLVLEAMSSPQSNSPYPLVWVQASAVREDGSSVQMFFESNIAHVPTHERDIYDVGRGVLTIVDELSESVSTKAISAHDIATRRILTAASCGGKPAGQILGFDVEYSEAQESMTSDSQRGTHVLNVVKKWTAPNLGCYALRRETIMTHDDGTLAADTTVQAFDVRLQPVDKFFEIPASYVERSPSEIDRERRRRYPQLLPMMMDFSGADLTYKSAHGALKY